MIRAGGAVSEGAQSKDGSAPANSQGGLRTDVQAMRGFYRDPVGAAVSRAALAGAGGFLSVDIFFVVSGFLVPGLFGAICSPEIQFYRILFSARQSDCCPHYIVFLACAPVAPLFLDAAGLWISQAVAPEP